MKTSKKLLIAIALFLLALIIITAIIVRQSINAIHNKAEQKLNYTALKIGNFENIHVAACYEVRIKQNQHCNVIAIADTNTLYKPKIKNVNGTLYLEPDSITLKNGIVGMQIRIEMPIIMKLEAKSGAKISMLDFECDSVELVFDNNVIFNSKNNVFGKTVIKTAGKTEMLFVKDN